jgi:hypothetical protein
MVSKNECPYIQRKILTSKQAKKEPIGSFYHPTEERVRSGACPIGFELKKGYEKPSYKTKKGTIVKESYVDPVCIKNKGVPGKLLEEYKQVKSIEKNVLKKFGYSTKNSDSIRKKSLLDASKELSYSSVIKRLVLLRSYTKISDEKSSLIYDKDIKSLQKWRKQNPELYKKKSILKGGDGDKEFMDLVKENIKEIIGVYEDEHCTYIKFEEYLKKNGLFNQISNWILIGNYEYKRVINYGKLTIIVRKRNDIKEKYPVLYTMYINNH